MELICEKYQLRMGPEEAGCRNPKEYCKFRTACMAHFVSRENVVRDRAGAAEQRGAAGPAEKK